MKQCGEKSVAEHLYRNVRDRILGIENLTDIDIAVEYHFDAFLRVFNEYFETKTQMVSRFKTTAYS
ncbi:MAG: hypothetical protein R6U89_06040, partial [Dehalococcoidia bacterium]